AKVFHFPGIPQSVSIRINGWRNQFESKTIDNGVVISHGRVSDRPAVTHNGGLGAGGDEAVRNHDAVGPRGGPAGSHETALPLVWCELFRDQPAVDTDIKTARP